MGAADLHGAAATTLATLYGRALDARSPHPVLGDAAADRAAAALDLDRARLGVGPREALGIAARAKLMDRWTREFLAAHAGAVVLHLGCGLDGRAERVDPGPDVLWFDVDQPEVVALRAQVLPPVPGVRTVAASVLDPAWLADVPRDRPAFVVAEGLTMYLPAAEGPALLRRLVAHLRSGGMAFDSWSRLGVRLSRAVPVLRRAGARLDWGIDDPHEPERLVPGLRLVEGRPSLRALDPDDLARAPRSLRRRAAVLARTPLLRDAGHIARYAFG